MNHYTQEVTKSLKPFAVNDSPYKRFRELCTDYDCFGIRLPKMREIFKRGYSFSSLPHEEQRLVWDHIWKDATNHEVLTFPLFYFEKRKLKNDLSDWKILKTWITKIDGWEHGDRLAGIYSHLLERFPEKIYPTLLQWNKARHPWKRRNSILALIYYASPKRAYLPVSKILPLVEPLIPEKDPYIQKAVGWTLRECWTLYPEETYRFMEKWIKDLSATSFSYATERLSKRDKNRLKTQRKK